MTIVGLILVLGGVVAWWYLGRRGSGERQHLDLLYQAWNQFNRKDYDAATATLDRRESLVFPTPLDWMLRARIAEAQGRPADGLAFLSKIPDSDATAPQAWFKAGQFELALHHSRAAEAAFQRSLVLDATQVPCHRQLAYLYTLQRRWAECDARFRAIARLTTLDHVLLFAWCQNSCRLWDPNESGKVLRSFLEADPEDRLSRLALAVSLQMTSRREEAEALLAPLGPGDSDAIAIRLQLAIDRGDIAAAEELSRGGDADHPRLNILRGTLALHDRDARRAADLFRKALALEPEDRDAIHGLGLALQRLSDPRAREYLDTAARHDRLKRTIQDSATTLSTDPRLFLKLGGQCESLHRSEEARGWYRLAIARDPSDEQAHEGLARVEALLPKPDTPPSPDRKAVAKS